MNLPVIESCNDCGACCRHIGTPPGFAAFFPPASREFREFMKGTPDDDIVKSMPVEVRTELADYYSKVWRNEIPDRSGYDCACLWYDAATKQCKHYEHRPSICREFEMAGEDCRRLRQIQGVDHAE